MSLSRNLVRAVRNPNWDGRVPVRLLPERVISVVPKTSKVCPKAWTEAATRVGVTTGCNNKEGRGEGATVGGSVESPVVVVGLLDDDDDGASAGSFGEAGSVVGTFVVIWSVVGEKVVVLVVVPPGLAVGLSSEGAEDGASVDVGTGSAIHAVEEALIVPSPPLVKIVGTTMAVSTTASSTRTPRHNFVSGDILQSVMVVGRPLLFQVLFGWSSRPCGTGSGVTVTTSAS